MHTYINKWRPIEIAVLLALAVTLLVGAASLHRQDGLQEKMIRLHVIANSDSEDDQTMKLLARDAVLTRAEAILRQASNREEAMEDLNAALPELERTAYDACGGAYPVHAALEMTEFPRKEYDGFGLPAGEEQFSHLPAGEYMALRVIIGEGAGRNWWCVVYPPLCMASCTELEDTALRAGLDGDDVQLDNVARTVICNNVADCHIALHWDGDGLSYDKGCFYISVPDALKSMEPVASHWQQHDALGAALIAGLQNQGAAIYKNGQMSIDLTQTSYSTIPSVDMELGNACSDHSDEALSRLADGLTEGVNGYFD